MKTQKADRSWVYVLRLQGSPPNYYVGSTRSLGERIVEHFSPAEASKWTDKYPPTSVIETIECPGGCPLALERSKTVEYVMKFGPSRVRGANFCKVDAPTPQWYDPSGLARKRARDLPVLEVENYRETYSLDLQSNHSTENHEVAP